MSLMIVTDAAAMCYSGSAEPLPSLAHICRVTCETIPLDKESL
jgi:hypothetical protein